IRGCSLSRAIGAITPQHSQHLIIFVKKSVTIYSTNLIESFNKQIKRYSRRKEQFQNEESLERFLVSIFDTYNQKFLNRSHKGFQQVTDTLVSMFTE
ncbi:transposase, partial [Enterococcus faecium]|uniref:transposase n=1 Tax=Enterococcus faecium TaxID=1352 RepID=UPI003984FB76